MKVLLVSHTHWDREWHHPFQDFRGHLVDVVDEVLDTVAADPDFRFLLDGQAIVVEDYLAVRPGRREELRAAVAGGRLGVGPWWVQPDSLLPSGESHVRNLLLGQRVSAEIGGGSRVAYVPDSFGHPAQFPQLFAGFGLGPFVYWRGGGDEVDTLPSLWRWVGPDGTAVSAYHLAWAYNSAANLDGAPPDGAVAHLRDLVGLLAATLPQGAPVLLPNGSDHMPADRTAPALARSLAETTGWDVRPALLDDLIGDLPEPTAAWSGELLGGRTANLLPGVWSTRLPLKLLARRVERALQCHAEPAAALARALLDADESPSLHLAWRHHLANTAHDSIGGCSVDAVHEQMVGRDLDALGLAEATTRRCLDRVGGAVGSNPSPWSRSVEVAVWNLTGTPVTDVVRIPLEPWPMLRFGSAPALHPWFADGLARGGYTCQGAPVRLVDDDPGRFRMFDGHRVPDAELVVFDVPAYGFRVVRLEPGPDAADDVDDGRVVSAGDVTVASAGDGTLTVTIGDERWRGLLAVEDRGDRGDSYDAELLDDASVPSLRSVEFRRARHPGGIEELTVTRRLALPAGLTADRSARSDDFVECTLVATARVAPGVPRVDLAVHLDNTARDHRLRLVFPTGAPVREALAATTFDVVRRTTARPAATGWKHPPPETFPSQGWVAANGLAVIAPGLSEVEVTPEGDVCVTLVRSVGWLSRFLSDRPDPAGPGIAVPGAQCLGPVAARLSLLAVGEDPSTLAARAVQVETGLLAAQHLAGAAVQEGRSLLAVSPASVVVSAIKPAEDGDGIVVRLLNPTTAPVVARVEVGFPVRMTQIVRLDESATPEEGVGPAHDLGRVPVPAHGLVTLRLVPARSTRS